jgi:MraZ protein
MSLGSGVVITRGFQKYLHLYPKSVWDETVEPELQGSILDEAVADLNVKFRTGKTEAALRSKTGQGSYRATPSGLCRLTEM